MSLDIVAKPLGAFLYFCYNSLAFHNYGLAIIIFTIVVKLVLLPLTIKQYKSTAKMQELQPQIKEIQTRYKNDKEKLNQELMKVYADNKANPTGGCLPLIVQMPIILSLYWVIIQPLKFMLNKDPITEIPKIVDFVTKIKGAANMGYQKEIAALNYFYENPEQLANIGGILKKSELINMNFLGLNLGLIPSYQWSVISQNIGTYLPLLIIPIVAVITTFISTKLSMPKQTPDNKNSAAAATTNSMLYVGPIMTLIFSFQMPAGVGMYWSIGYVFTIFQQLYINKYVMKKKEVVVK